MFDDVVVKSIISRLEDLEKKLNVPNKQLDAKVGGLLEKISLLENDLRETKGTLFKLQTMTLDNSQQIMKIVVPVQNTNDANVAVVEISSQEKEEEEEEEALHSEEFPESTSDFLVPVLVPVLVNDEIVAQEQDTAQNEDQECKENQQTSIVEEEKTNLEVIVTDVESNDEE